jgi:hypothetical protein
MFVMCILCLLDLNFITMPPCIVLAYIVFLALITVHVILLIINGELLFINFAALQAKNGHMILELLLF